MKNKRKLLSGRRVCERSREMKLSITTKCPDKWLFVDLETGDVWHAVGRAKEGKYPFWRRANEVEKKDMRLLAARRQDRKLALLKRDTEKMHRAMKEVGAAMRKRGR